MAELQETVFRKARKRHDCHWCGALINLGSKYEYTSWREDGSFWQAKVCLDCVRLRDMCRGFDERGYYEETYSLDDLVEEVMSDWGHGDGSYEELYLHIAKFLSRKTYALTMKTNGCVALLRNAGIDRPLTVAERLNAEALKDPFDV